MSLYPDKIMIGDIEYAITPTEDLQVNQMHINDEFATHSEKFGWYSTAYELAVDYELRKKAELERAYANLDQEARLYLADQKKVTEKMVENMVITSDLYKQIQEEYLDAKKNTGVLKGIRDAMMHKRDMLVGLGANYRAEGQSELSLKLDQLKKNR